MSYIVFHKKHLETPIILPDGRPFQVKNIEVLYNGSVKVILSCQWSDDYQFRLILFSKAILHNLKSIISHKDFWNREEWLCVYKTHSIEYEDVQ